MYLPNTLRRGEGFGFTRAVEIYEEQIDTDRRDPEEGVERVH
jgi:hypothetical protein